MGSKISISKLRQMPLAWTVHEGEKGVWANVFGRRIFLSEYLIREAEELDIQKPVELAEQFGDSMWANGPDGRFYIDLGDSVDSRVWHAVKGLIEKHHSIYIRDNGDIYLVTADWDSDDTVRGLKAALESLEMGKVQVESECSPHDDGWRLLINKGRLEKGVNLADTPYSRSQVVEDDESWAQAWAKGPNGEYVPFTVHTKSGRIKEPDVFTKFVKVDPAKAEEGEGGTAKPNAKTNPEQDEEDEPFEMLWCEAGGIPFNVSIQGGTVLNMDTVLAAVNLRQLDPGQKGEGSSHKGSHYVEGHKFIGFAADSSGKRWELHQNVKSSNQFRAVHPTLGTDAPPGTEFRPHENYKGAKLIGYKATPRGVLPIRDEQAREAGKVQHLQAMAKSQKAMREKVRADLALPGLPKEKVAALVTLLIFRHLFRIGDGVGTTNVNKGKRDAEGNPLPEQLEETYGVTEFQAKKHVINSNGRIKFAFRGKAAVPWERYEDDPQAASLVEALNSMSKEGEKLFQYLENGVRKPINAEDIREYIAPFGFTPHRVRNYYASYLFYAKVKEILGDKTADKTKDKRAAFNAGMAAAAEALNDTPGAAKNYVLQSLQRSVLEEGRLPVGFKMQDIKLIDDGDTMNQMPDELPFEEEFNRYVRYRARSMSDLFPSLAAEELSTDLQEVWLGPWPELGPDDHWITLKPHGPEAEDYRHVIVHDNKDGTGRIVWSGDKGLMHLRINKIGKPGEKPQKARPMTPEEKQKAMEDREARGQKRTMAHQSFGQALLKEMGIEASDADALAVAMAYDNGLKRVMRERTPEERDAQRQALEEKIQSILNDEEVPKEAAAGGTSAGEKLVKAIAEAEAQRAVGIPMQGLSGVSPEIEQAWDEIRKDPAKAERIAALAAKRREDLAAANKLATSGRSDIRVIDNIGYEGEPDEATAALMRQAHETANYLMTSKFWREVGVAGQGIKEQYDNGSLDAIAVFGMKYGIGRIDTPSVAKLGTETIAAALASAIRAKGPSVAKAALDGLREHNETTAMKTVAESLQEADAIAEERKHVAGQIANGELVGAVRIGALAERTIERQKVLGRVAGGLGTAAAIGHFLRQENPDGADIDAGQRTDEVRSYLESMNFNEGDGYEMRMKDGKQVVHIPEEKLAGLIKSCAIQYDRDERLAKIKAHEEIPTDFETPYLESKNEDGTPVRPTESQIAAVQAIEYRKKIYGNIGVGMGKTLTFGLAAARMIDRGETHGGWYILPGNLIRNTLADLNHHFPGLRVEIADGTVKADKRRELYKSKPHIMLISQDTIRSDGDFLAEMAASEGDAPGFIFGDEAHSMFTPNENELPSQQSQRSMKMQELRAPVMAMATGTPLRKSPVEIWKVANYLEPGKLGTLNAFKTTYGSVGEGVSAFGNIQEHMLQQALSDLMIHESAPKPAKEDNQVHNVGLNPEQWADLRDAETAHREKLKQIDSDRSLSNEIKNTRRMNQIARHADKVQDLVYNRPLESNPMLQTLHAEVARMGPLYGRGLIHCRRLKAVQSIVESFPKGAIMPVTGTMSGDLKNETVQAVNRNLPYTGGRVAGPNGEGVVKTKFSLKAGPPEDVEIEKDDGTVYKAKYEDLSPRYVAIAGTSTCNGVISTGLNAQGMGWTYHYQLADSAATEEQRNARTNRKGQKRNMVGVVTSVPDTPAARSQYRKMQVQRRKMSAIKDTPDIEARKQMAQNAKDDIRELDESGALA